MKPERQYEFVLLGIGLAFAVFLLPAIVGTFYDSAGFWMMLIVTISATLIYLVVNIFFTVKRLNPDVDIVPPGFKI